MSVDSGRRHGHRPAGGEHGGAGDVRRLFACLANAAPNDVLDKFRGDVIIPALKVHPKVFFGGMLLENPYFVDPDEPEG